MELSSDSDQAEGRVQLGARERKKREGPDSRSGLRSNGRGFPVAAFADGSMFTLRTSATSASRVFYEPIIGDGGLNLSD